MGRERNVGRIALPKKFMLKRHLSLSDREKEIVLLAAEGLGDKEIANKLGIAEGTVRTYWDRLRPKIGATNRAQATAQLLVALYQDTEHALKQVGDRSQLIIENLKDFAIFGINMERLIESWNPGVEHLFGYTEEEWIGKSPEIIFTDKDRASGIPDWEMTTAEKEGRAEDERWHVRKDGSIFWGGGVMIGLREPDGSLVGHAKILRDYSERQQRDAKIQALEAELDTLRGTA